MTHGTHVPVLLEEAVEGLGIGARPDGIYVDATFGRGGHARRILEALGAHGRLLALDRDAEAVTAAAAIEDARFSVRHARFGLLGEALRAEGIASIDGVLFDIGVSSPQIDDPSRGFSFRADGPLDMRMDRSTGETAAQWLARAEEKQIREVIERHGEERFAKQIAKAIVAARQGGALTGTRQLADLVGQAVRTREPGQDPATRTFQALRIHLNQELEELPLALAQAVDALAPGGRVAVITFHSLEDRIAKRFLRDASRPGQMPERLPLRAAQLPPPRLKLVGKAVRPSPAEVSRNPRSRSATLRVAEKL